MLDRDRKIMIHNPKSILIHSSNWVGDTIMSLPAIQLIRASFSSARITIIVRKHIASIFNKTGLVDDVIYTPTAKGIDGLREELSLHKVIKRNGYDLAILFPNSFISALRVFGCGIMGRIGYANEGRSILLTSSVKRTKIIVNEHMTHYYLNILTLLDLSIPKEVKPSLPIPEQLKQFAESYIRKNKHSENSRLIALGIGTAQSKAKMWDKEHFITLANTLIERYNFEVVLITSPNERRLAEQIAYKLSKRPLIPHTNLLQSASIISMCDVFVGNDSGAMHLAYAVNTPTIGLYFSTNPKSNYPLGVNSSYIAKKIHCAYCGKDKCDYDTYECTRAINPTEIIDKLKEMKIIS
jgi:heptosyltransferase II